VQRLSNIILQHLGICLCKDLLKWNGIYLRASITFYPFKVLSVRKGAKPHFIFPEKARKSIHIPLHATGNNIQRKVWLALLHPVRLVLLQSAFFEFVCRSISVCVYIRPSVFCLVRLLIFVWLFRSFFGFVFRWIIRCMIGFLFCDCWIP
jgi:hypothetical protein